MTETLTLANVHLLVTRPEAQAVVWAEQLRVLGATVTVQPMMKIVPVDTDEAKQCIKNMVLNFAEYQKAIFVSQNAVNYGLQWLDQYWPQLPVDVEFFAIGTATASLLEEGIGQGALDAGYLSHSAYSAMNSEALLAHPRLQSVAGEKIVIFRGQGGRTVLADQLHEKGATVEYCELYRRETTITEPQTLPVDYRCTSAQPITVIHSGETLENVCSMITPDDLLWLQKHPLLLPGERVAQLAKQAGFRRLIVAKNATHDSMIEALNEWQRYDK